MKLGRWELTTISGGRFRVDGGNMFAVVPKVLWTRKIVPDELNRIPEACNCLLLRDGERTILIETGYGSKLTEKQRKQHASEAGDPLVASLAKQGVTPEQVDTVILTHLHFDHAGGVTRKNDVGELVLTFPNATHIIQRGEWEIALADLPELKGVYSRENLSPLIGSDKLQLIDGDAEILPGLTTRVTGGHTEFHQIVVIEGGGDGAVFLGDICPSSWHLPTAWCIGYDLYQMQTRRTKRAILSECAEKNWWLLYDHDPEYAGSKVVAAASGEWSIADGVKAF